MKVIDAGHTYMLTSLDGDDDQQHLVFVKREGDKYPGNVGHHAGTNVQDVCRVLIDRLQYVNNQIYSSHNDIAIRYLRGVILELEVRAAKRHGRRLLTRHNVESEQTCSICGHIQCNESCRKTTEEPVAIEAEGVGAQDSQGGKELS